MTDGAMKEKAGQLVAHLAFERPDTAARLCAAATSLGLSFERLWDLRAVQPEIEEVGVLVVEDRSEGEELRAHVQSFVGLAQDGLLVMVVPHPRDPVESPLRELGAFDVIDDGPDMPQQLARILSIARRFAALRKKHATLGADLAHRERLSALGLLAASVGHEINNPCAVVLSNASTMREQLEAILARPRFQQVDAMAEYSADWLDGLGDTIGAARRIASIVATLNVFSRRSPDAQPELVHLNDSVNAVLRFIGKEVRFQAEIELVLDPELPPVLAVPHTMMQVLTNLVANALQAMTGGATEHPKLRIRTRADLHSVLLEVTDNGPGIAPDVVGRVFDPFFTTKSGTGTGLGLAVTRELVQKAGGDVLVESQVGHGACFRIILPRAILEEPVMRAPSVRPPSGQLRVMIVDDDDSFLRSVTRSLREQFECIPVKSVDAARTSLARDSRIDVLVTDVVMPGENGLDLYRGLLLEHPELAPRTVFLSGGVSSESLLAALQKTGRPIIGKPVDMHDLFRTLRLVSAL